ncbi:MAG: helix-turn-helix domain-containing protein [Pseudomonadota bacterium]
MLSIGQLSERTGVKIPTIRYYEKMGLIDAPDRSEGNQRRYTQEGLKRLAFVRHARELGFSIEDIRELVDLSKLPEEPCTNAHDIAVRHLAATKARISTLKRLEKELKRIAACDAGSVAECTVIESLADHGLCHSEH